MNLNEVKEWLGADWTRVQEILSSALGSDIDLLNKVNAAILANSGKQLRPVLSLLVARACGQVNGDTYKYAAAAELLHNATLLHDDVADESDTRRGKPTINSLMGPSASVLVGDFWLVKAMGCILDAEHSSNEVIRIFAKTLSDLAEGEMLQLQKADSCDTTEEDYLRIIYSKTASLFEASAVSAAISAGVSDDVREAVRKIAVSLGLAFQIRDDIFDYSPDMNVGKPVGADILESKITMPLIGAFANAGTAEEARVRELVRNIASNPEARGEICAFVHENGGIAYAQQKLEAFIDEAVATLEILGDSEEKRLLARVVNYVGDRKI